MDLEGMVAQLDEAGFARLQQMVATGRWPDGNTIDPDQRDVMMQAAMLYQARQQDNQQHLTINRQGDLNQLSKQQLKTQFKPNQTIERFSHDDL